MAAVVRQPSGGFFADAVDFVDVALAANAAVAADAAADAAAVDASFAAVNASFAAVVRLREVPDVLFFCRVSMMMW